MTKNDINRLINIYETDGKDELIKYLYSLKNEYKLQEILKKYCSSCFVGENILFYASLNEQIFFNNKSSILYFNKVKFKNLYDILLTTSSKFIKKEELEFILNTLKSQCSNTCRIKDVSFNKNNLDVYIENNLYRFNKEECEIVRDLLSNPEFKASDKNPILHAKSNEGYAYILGKKLK